MQRSLFCLRHLRAGSGDGRALISNTDDHPRNYAVIAMDADFRLAPAYDLIPFTPVSVERRDLAMSIGDAGARRAGG